MIKRCCKMERKTVVSADRLTCDLECEKTNFTKIVAVPYADKPKVKVSSSTPFSYSSESESLPIRLLLSKTLVDTLDASAYNFWACADTVGRGH